MERTFTTAELSRETGVPVSTLKRWVTSGYLAPAVRSLGRGDAFAFTEDQAAQARALPSLSDHERVRGRRARSAGDR